MKRYLKIVSFFSFLLLGVLSFRPFLPSIKAANLSLGDASLYHKVPAKILVGQEFTIELGFKVEKTMEVSMARIAMQYPSDYIKLKKVILNKNLFCKYPDDSNNRLLDEADGRLILTGLADGTADCPYPQLSPGKEYPLLQITFIALQSGVPEITFIYDKNAVDGDFTFLTANGSPPVMVLGEPDTIDLLIAKKVKPTPTPPHTGIIDNQLYWAILLIWIALLIIIVPKLKRKLSLKKSRTVVYQ